MGAQVSIINRLGQDDFAKVTLDVWEESGVTAYIQQSPDDYTRAAYILSKRSLATMLLLLHRALPPKYRRQTLRHKPSLTPQPMCS